MTPISSPMAGDVHPLADVPDPVFAQGLVGPGVAIVPIGEAEVTVVAPIAGRIVKLHPHAFVIQAQVNGLMPNRTSEVQDSMDSCHAIAAHSCHAIAAMHISFHCID